jgi:Protein of unknown function (DUF3142)
MKLVHNRKLRWLLFLALFIATYVSLRLGQPTTAVLSVTESDEAITTLQALPHTMLWAWERPERLDFIDTTKVGVAFLAKTISLRDGEIAVRSRLQPLRLAKGTKVVAVIRIESNNHAKPSLSDQQIVRVTREVVQTVGLPDVLGIQIDFDAKASEREFYRRLLLAIKQQLRPTMPLSVTALASWCAGDNWLSDIPVDEAVPMLFRMGVDRAQFRSRLSLGEDPFTKPCSEAAGVSTDESITPPRRRRLYIFSPKPWTPDSVNAALETYSL